MPEDLETPLVSLLRDWEYVLLYLSAASIASGVAINFAVYDRSQRETVAGERLVVATLTMTLFFVVLFLLARFDVGRLHVSPPTDLTARVVGSGLVLFAAAVNIAARLALGRFWSNQIEIVADHEVIRSWPYSWSRHPMYGSLIVFGVGMGLLALNPGVVAATLALFVPAMRYRAGREEALLLEALGATYLAYRNAVTMLLPRLPELHSRIARGILGGIQVWAAAGALLDLMLLSAVLTVGLSFVMARPDFRIVYRFVPAVIGLCVLLAWVTPSLAFLLWLPALASLASLSGHCPGTLLLRRVNA